jgi:hypothetical protein
MRIVLRFGIWPVRVTIKACWLAGFVFASTAAAQEPGQHEAVPAVAPAAAAEMKNPAVSSANVDWALVRAALAGLDPLTSSDDTNAKSAADALTRLNTATGKTFPKIAVSPVPVLLPFDTAAFLRDEAQGTAADASKYLSGLNAATFFFPGPSGYDAALSLRPQDSPRLGVTFAKPIDVQISGSALVYDLDGPTVSDGTPVPELETEFPGIRRVLLESHVRYTFTRFGAPYFVSILCFDGASRAHRLSCRDADKVAVRFIKALNVVGGTPQTGPAKTAAPTIDRPETISSDFTYYPAGDILPGTGVRGQGGRTDSTVFSKIRFPMAQGPAYANSQSFMNWGDCDHTGRVSLDGRGVYRCRVNQWLLVTDESKNYAYPWRDNFCEHRYYYVGQCPAGLGHQGQDIRPASCQFRVDGAGRCDPYQQDVVAVRDGIVLRSPGDLALYLVVDKPGEHLRFRYLHMNPQMLDAAGMVSGRVVSEGEVIGAVGNYSRRAGGTTYHLHFDVQVPTREGWVFVNPYMTLVAAYERLISGRGQVVRDPVLASAGDSQTPESPAQTATRPDGQPVPNSAAISAPRVAETPQAAAPDAIVPPNILAESATGTRQRRSERTSERETVSAEHCKARIAKGHRRRLCGADRADNRRRGRHAHAVRSLERHVSHQSHSARHHGRDVHTRHARRTSRHGRA